jgi:hypothetical protein
MNTVPATESDVSTAEVKRAALQAEHDERMKADAKYAMTYRADRLKMRCLRTVPSRTLMEAVDQGNGWMRREKIKKLRAQRDALKGTQATTAHEHEAQ